MARWASEASARSAVRAQPAPPPGAGFGWGEPDEDESTLRGIPPRRSAPRSVGYPFAADLDVCELDDRQRPGLTWSARGLELGRAHLIIRSRRMCYPGRLLLVAVHLIDDKPVPLFGRVQGCDYDGDGLYKVDLELLPVPNRHEIRDWLKARGPGAGRG